MMELARSARINESRVRIHAANPVHKAASLADFGNPWPPVQSRLGNHAIQARLYIPPPHGNGVPQRSQYPTAQIRSLRGSGAPLPSATRSFFEQRFGSDFHDVRVHLGPQASEAAKSVRAQAFTIGPDIVFGQNQYAPNTPDGQKLLAHELTHVLQQSAAGCPRPGAAQRQEAPAAESETAATEGPSAGEIRAAVIYNRLQFADPEAVRILRGAVGLDPTSAGNDEILARAVWTWQGTHQLTQDGKAGPITAHVMAEELDAQDQAADAQLLRSQYRTSRMFDIDQRFCGCEGEVERMIHSAKIMRGLYQECGEETEARHQVAWQAIENCVNRKAGELGGRLVRTAVTTIGGDIHTREAAGSCGPIINMDHFVHEYAHRERVHELMRRFGASTPKFNRIWFSAADRWKNECDAYSAEIRYLNWVKALLASMCSTEK